MLVGRSNVGKSSLINALTRQKVARTSAEPGKTRLANVYRIERESAPPFHLVDLPGYGYARREKAQSTGQPAFEDVARAAFDRHPAALLLVDARHPGLDSDRSAWAWMRAATERAAVVATKIDKLARGERIRAMRQLQSVYDAPVLPVSASTGEGMEDLWKLIASLSKPRPRRTNPNA